MTRLYLDYNAGAPLRPEAREAMLEALAATGNASSVHAEGREGHRRLEEARAEVAALVAGDPGLVTFTSGGTEANVTALTPEWLRDGKPARADVLLAGSTEHPSVLAGGRFPADRVQHIPVDTEGVVDLAALADRLAAATENGERALVSVMLANNETGVIQPIAEVASLARDSGAIVHCDAVQAAGRIPIDINDLGVDVLGLSAHKIGGPQGAGAIVRRSGSLTFQPLLTGGGQEKRSRAGTENVAAIAGFGAAARAAANDIEKAGFWSGLRDGITAALGEGGRRVTVFAAGAPRLPQTLCVAVEGIAAETLVIALDLEGVAVSSGSACSSGKVAPSHVLSAMQVPGSLAKGAIRISLGWDSQDSCLDLFVTAWRRVLKHIAPGQVWAA